MRNIFSNIFSNTILRKSIIVLILSVTAFSCAKKDVGTSLEQQNKEAITNYANIVLATYEDSYTSAVLMQQKIDAFVALPTAQGLTDCKNAWLTARNVYGQTEAFRFYAGPIDGDDGLEGYINAWPMDENAIDYVAGNTNAGLINDAVNYPNITKKVILDLNEVASETSIFTGWHAVEFLLWGQDLSPTSAGTRPYTDFLTTNGTAQNQVRRKIYLKVVSDLLIEHLGIVRNAWKTGSVYREGFVNNTDIPVVLGKIFTGIGSLCKGELSGQRMFAAVDSQDQENEHSCFSDNTINDIKMNFLGIKNVYLGTYTRIDGSKVTGKSFAEITQTFDKTKAAAVITAFADVDAKINLIPLVFDQAIINNPTKILDAVQALRTCSDKLADASIVLKAKL